MKFPRFKPMFAEVTGLFALELVPKAEPPRV